MSATPQTPEPADGATQGLLAFGDSITNAGGELQLGVALQSWALWTARGLGIPYTPYAVDGAVAGDVVARQMPLFLRVNADPDARFRVGCLHIGTNDIRLPSWDPFAFTSELDRAVAFLSARCERTVLATLPTGMGRPPQSERIREANAIILETGARHGALILDLADFGARNTVMADHVHPTALGQVAIAERALALLARDGMSIRLDPSTQVAPSRSRLTRLLSDGTYVCRCIRQRTLATYWQWRLRPARLPR